MRLYNHDGGIEVLTDFPETSDVGPSLRERLLWKARESSRRLRVRRPPSKVAFAKRAIDIGLTSTLGLFTMPLIGLIALAIKLDSRGPVMFVQRRPGLDGKYFNIYKFRTMRSGRAGDYRQLHPRLREEFDTYGKIRNDPRVTRVGRLLRRTSLDELPQLWNIFKGDMSLVGPRPYLDQQIEELADRRQTIFRIRPGLTGVWQVNGRNDLVLRRRLAMDIWYVRNHSLRTDSVILLRTVTVVLRGDGAY